MQSAGVDFLTRLVLETGLRIGRLIFFFVRKGDAYLRIRKRKRQLYFECECSAKHFRLRDMAEHRKCYRETECEFPDLHARFAVQADFCAELPGVPTDQRKDSQAAFQKVREYIIDSSFDVPRDVYAECNPAGVDLKKCFGIEKVDDLGLVWFGTRAEIEEPLRGSTSEKKASTEPSPSRIFPLSGIFSFTPPASDQLRLAPSRTRYASIMVVLERRSFPFPSRTITGPGSRTATRRDPVG